MAVEREGLAEELARLDVDLPAVTIEGEVYRQVVRCEETYTSAAGPVRVMRSLYRRLGEGERTLCPLELRAGIVEGRWTPLAAPRSRAHSASCRRCSGRKKERMCSGSWGI